jgi:hypothetical protein
MDTFVSSSPAAIGGQIMSPGEERFWEKMNFRQFAVLTVRLQAIWMVFDGVLSATNLQTYFSRMHDMFSEYGDHSGMKHLFFWAIFRVFWHLAGAIICIRYADRIISWLVKDMIPKPPATPGAAESPAPIGK